MKTGLISIPIVGTKRGLRLPFSASSDGGSSNGNNNNNKRSDHDVDNDGNNDTDKANNSDEADFEKLLWMPASKNGWKRYRADNFLGTPPPLRGSGTVSGGISPEILSAKKQYYLQKQPKFEEMLFQLLLYKAKHGNLSVPSPRTLARDRKNSSSSNNESNSNGQNNNIKKRRKSTEDDIGTVSAANNTTATTGAASGPTITIRLGGS